VVQRRFDVGAGVSALPIVPVAPVTRMVLMTAPPSMDLTTLNGMQSGSMARAASARPTSHGFPARPARGRRPLQHRQYLAPCVRVIVDALLAHFSAAVDLHLTLAISSPRCPAARATASPTGAVEPPAAPLI